MIKQIFLIVLAYTSCCNALQSQDSLQNSIDTIICKNHISTFYDTINYNSTWYSLTNLDLLSLEDSISVNILDSIVLVSTPINPTDTTFIDTIYIKVWSYLDLDLVIPPNECYDGNDLIILDNTVIDSHSSVSYVDVNNNELPILDNSIVVPVENGDSIKISATYKINECPDFDTTLTLRTLLRPTAKFTELKVCENEFLSFINSSSDTSFSSYHFILENDNYEVTSGDTLFFIDTIPNGSYSGYGIVENSNDCIDSFSLTNVTIDSVTYVSFEGLLDSYCENQDTAFLIANVSGGSFDGMFLANIVDSMGMASFIPTTTATNLEISYSYTNNQQCTDIATNIVEVIHPKPQLELMGVNDEYCELDLASEIFLDSSLLDFSIFTIFKDDDFFESNNSFNILFDPVFPGEYSIMNMHTDTNGCFDMLIKDIIVNPLPLVDLDSSVVIMPGDGITIGSSFGSETNVSYLWSNGDDTPFLFVDLPGVYILEATNIMTSCSVQDTSKVEYDSSIESQLIEVQISPNPTFGILTIKLSSQKQNIVVTNVFGEQVVINGSSELTTDVDGNLTLDLSNLQAGYYYLIIPNVGNFLIVKI